MLRTAVVASLLALTSACAPHVWAAGFRGAQQGFNAGPGPSYSSGPAPQYVGATSTIDAARYRTSPPSYGEQFLVFNQACLSDAGCPAGQVCYKPGPNLGVCVNHR